MISSSSTYLLNICHDINNVFLYYYSANQVGKKQAPGKRGDRLVSPYPAVGEQRVALLDENRLNEGDICGAQYRLSAVVDAKHQQQPQKYIILYRLRQKNIDYIDCCGIFIH